MPPDKTDPFQAIYIPTLSLEQVALVRETSSLLPKTVEELQKEANEFLTPLQVKLRKGIGSIRYSEPRPLTLEEAKDVIKERTKILFRLQSLRQKLGKVEDYVDKRLTSEGSRFTYHFKKKPRLSKAVKTLFGETREYITYDDYKKALALKKQLEQEDAYSFFEEDNTDTYEVT